MKHFISFALLIFSGFLSHAQALNYEGIGLLISRQTPHGTARFNAMGGAFGALGGDVSASYSNPASGAVFNHNEFSGSLHSSTTKTKAAYYQTNTYNEFTKVDVPQWGAVFIFDNTNRQSPWNKFAISINYSLEQDFNNNYSGNGKNSTNFATFINHPNDNNDPQIAYLYSENQSFTNDTRGQNEVYTFSISTAYENTLYIGASINTYAFDFTQEAFLYEDNTDGNGNELFADFIQYQSQTGNGISAGIGVIAKPIQNIRLGLSYQTPVWYYDIQEESNINDADSFLGDTRIETNTIATVYQNNPIYNSYNYTLRTPSKTTFSTAFLFNKSGLISIDYSLQNFKKTHLDDRGNTFKENNDLISTIANEQLSTLRIGSEWRVKQWRLRGGYVQQENTLAHQPHSFALKKYSLGLGFQFKNTKVDLSYETSNQKELYDFYPQYDQIDPATLNFNNSKIGLTLSFLL
jgi:hypothetical protein